MRTKLAIAGVTAAALLGGGAAGLVLATPGSAGAQTSTTAPVTAPATTGSSATATPRGLPDGITAALAGLVTNGTITQAQADAVTKALTDAMPEGRGGRRSFGRGVEFGAAATTIGITTTELRTALEGGQTIAQVATSKGVDPQKVIDALVANVKLHLAQEVAAGEHTQAEADQKLADATTRITDGVNNGFPARGPGGDRDGGPGRPGDDDPSSSATTDPSTATTTG